MKFNLSTLVVLIFAVFGSASFGQDEPVRVETNLVSVNVAVTDKKGKFVKGLQQEQFEIFDNRQKQQITHFSVEEAPVTYGFVYDLHPTTIERTTMVLDALRSFTKELRPKDRFFILAFNERGSLNVDFVPTIKQLDNHLFDRREPNSLYDATYLAAEKLRESPNLKRTLIIVSDTADHQSRHSFSDLSRRLKGLDVQIYAVIFDENNNWVYRDVTLEGRRRRPISRDATALDRAAIEDLTRKSGGAIYSASSENSQLLFEIYREISAEVQRQYTISFYPIVTDGKWHSLRIGLRSVAGSKKFALTYRPGYQNPSLENKK